MTSLRFFAAAAIVVHHIQGSFGVPAAVVHLGLGVSFFFVLSGFILAYVYFDVHDASTSRRFYLARFARIWPLHAATLVFAALLLHPAWTSRSVGDFVANALLLQSWWPNLAINFSYNWVAWTISNEAFFYLLFPLVMIWRRQFAAIFSLTVAFLFFVFLVGGNLEPTAPATANNVASWYVLVMTGPPVRFFEFLFGMGIGFLYMRQRGFRMPGWAWSVIEVVAVLAIVVQATTVRAVLDVLGPALGPIFRQWYQHCGAFFVFGFAILCFAYRGGILSRVLSLPPLVLLGEISFSTYMIHQIIIRVWESQGWLLKEWNPVGLVVMLATIYVGSYLSWRFFERPAQRAILALARPRPTLAST